MQAALKARQKAAKEQLLDESNRWDCHLHRLLLQHSKAFTHSTLRREAHPAAERDPLSDEDEAQVVDDCEGAQEEPMMYEDLQAAFPMDFGEL